MSEIVERWTPTSAPVSFTEKACQYLHKMLKQQNAQYLRFGVRKSGCTGFAYVIEPGDQTESDQLYIIGDLSVLVDPKDLPIISGTEVDYIREGINQRLKFSNPNEKASCGCGESFSV